MVRACYCMHDIKKRVSSTKCSIANVHFIVCGNFLFSNLHFLYRLFCYIDHSLSENLVTIPLIRNCYQNILLIGLWEQIQFFEVFGFSLMIYETIKYRLNVCQNFQRMSIWIFHLYAKEMPANDFNVFTKMKKDILQKMTKRCQKS